jgi:enoyl-CoA hydratase/carnithine racemase
MLLTGAGGKAFAAGTDISQFRAFKGPEDALAYETRIDRVLSTLEKCRVPSVAVIDGACTGGGAAVAACCDLRIATSASRFGFPIARTLGNCLSNASLRRLTGLVGPARVKDMIFTARLLNAGEAAAIGLVTEVVADAEALAARADALAELIAGHAPLTLRATKEGLRRIGAEAAETQDNDLVVMCYTSDDFREGMEAFLTKRPPVWQGR